MSSLRGPASTRWDLWLSSSVRGGRLLELRACSINIRMQTSASCVQHTAWARTEFACALVDSVGRNATAADVGGATPFQLMLTVLNRRALSAWRSHGQAERRSWRICRALTTAASMRMRAARNVLNDPPLAHSRCALAGSVRGDVLQSCACPTVLANSDATARSMAQYGAFCRETHTSIE